MIAEPTDTRRPELAHPWSRRFTALMWLVVIVAAPLVGGGAAWLTIKWLSLAPFFDGFDKERDAPLLYLSAALTSLLVGPFFWWLIVLRPRSITPGRGAWVGVAGSLVAHPLTWLLAIRLNALLSGRGFLYREPERLSSPGDVLLSVAFFSWYSLILMGWFTALIGGLAGAGVAWGLRRLANQFASVGGQRPPLNPPARV